MKLGIVGLPNVGKSTLFNALTSAGAQAANYPFCTIEPNVGVVAVPDERLLRLAEMYRPKKVTPATIEFVDIAGLVKGASKGEGLGNRFLSHIRLVDAVLHVVRCFDSTEIVHVDGRVDPVSDIETINLELLLSDIEVVGRQIDKAKKSAKGDKKFEREAELFERLLAHLTAEKPARTFEASGDELEILAAAPLLSAKPVIYVCNMGEEDFSGYRDNERYRAVAALAESEGAKVLPVSAEFEAQLAELEEDEREMFLSEMGVSGSGLARLIKESYSLLGLISFLTAGEPEVRAWTITDGTKAPGAAGKIHTDFERGFIRAEVVAYDDLIKSGSVSAAKEQGIYRSEGKDYVMRDGDVVLFRFNV